ncbi:MAG: GPR endopeptidase [Clostridia bacterium]|nr:GPR endopeptidase [Clostridia bacterium]
MNIRTDLVTEEKELHTEEIEGALTEVFEQNGITVEKTVIQTEKSAHRLNKPKGTYFTLTFDNLQHLCDPEPLVDVICQVLSVLLPKHRDNVLTVGLGNREITPDALGPLTADKLLVTRHIGKDFIKRYGLQGLQSVSAITPGVIGKTGIETFEIVQGTVARTSPSALIVIDALAARRPERLCRTLQLTDTGICPGSGVHNSRKAINADFFGIPVIALGIPTVVDTGSLVFDLTGQKIGSAEEEMMVTPKDIDQLVDRAASILADALNRFLQPDLDREVLRCLA